MRTHRPAWRAIILTVHLCHPQFSLPAPHILHRLAPVTHHLSRNLCHPSVTIDRLHSQVIIRRQVTYQYRVLRIILRQPSSVMADTFLERAMAVTQEPHNSMITTIIQNQATGLNCLIHLHSHWMTNTRHKLGHIPHRKPHRNRSSVLLMVNHRQATLSTHLRQGRLICS